MRENQSVTTKVMDEVELSAILIDRTIMFMLNHHYHQYSSLRKQVLLLGTDVLFFQRFRLLFLCELVSFFFLNIYINFIRFVVRTQKQSCADNFPKLQPITIFSRCLTIQSPEQRHSSQNGRPSKINPHPVKSSVRNQCILLFKFALQGKFVQKIKH